MKGEESAAYGLPEWVKREQALRAADEQRQASALLGREPRKLFRGALTLTVIPGFAALWEQVVPAAHLEDLGRDRHRRRVGVLCTCGHEVQEIVTGEVLVCAGACSRWFLRTEKDVRVKRWTGEERDDVQMDEAA